MGEEQVFTPGCFMRLVSGFNRFSRFSILLRFEPHEFTLGRQSHASLFSWTTIQSLIFLLSPFASEIIISVSWRDGCNFRRILHKTAPCNDTKEHHVVCAGHPTGIFQQGNASCLCAFLFV